MKTNFFQKIIKRPRLIVQLLFSAVTNGYLYGFATGRIYEKSRTFALAIQK